MGIRIRGCRFFVGQICLDVGHVVMQVLVLVLVQHRAQDLSWSGIGE